MVPELVQDCGPSDTWGQVCHRETAWTTWLVQCQKPASAYKCVMHDLPNSIAIKIFKFITIRLQAAQVRNNKLSQLRSPITTALVDYYIVTIVQLVCSEQSRGSSLAHPVFRSRDARFNQSTGYLATLVFEQIISQYKYAPCITQDLWASYSISGNPTQESLQSLGNYHPPSHANVIILPRSFPSSPRR